MIRQPPPRRRGKGRLHPPCYVWVTLGRTSWSWAEGAAPLASTPSAGTGLCQTHDGDGHSPHAVVWLCSAPPNGDLSRGIPGASIKPFSFGFSFPPRFVCPACEHPHYTREKKFAELWSCCQQRGSSWRWVKHGLCFLSSRSPSRPPAVTNSGSAEGQKIYR